MNLFKISVPQLKAYRIIGQFHHSIIHSKSFCPYFLTYKMKLTPTERATVRIKWELYVLRYIAYHIEGAL